MRQYQSIDWHGTFVFSTRNHDRQWSKGCDLAATIAAPTPGPVRENHALGRRYGTGA
jgi:hypothetical protein